jgi:RNA polymerase sigma-70 factor (ECF subfamily)
MEEYVARLDSSLSTAFLLVMGSLTPAERMVLLLQKVFGYGHTEVASLVGESETNCFRLFRRAKRSAVARRPRFENASDRKEDPW